jgi:hypothetical protein
VQAIYQTTTIDMKKLFFFISILIHAYVFSQAPTETFPVDSASVEHAGVPKGELLKFTFDQSKIFPGTWREYWIYVPNTNLISLPAYT